MPPSSALFEDRPLWLTWGYGIVSIWGIISWRWQYVWHRRILAIAVARANAPSGYLPLITERVKDRFAAAVKAQMPSDRPRF